MWKYTRLAAMLAVASGFAASVDCVAQTPEQSQQWEMQRVQALAEDKVRAERVAREREARKADPMSWVRTLDPMTAGGWQFRTVAGDGSSAIFSTTHQLKRSGNRVTLWLRQEFAEPQSADNGRYLSVVQKMEYDCGKDRDRTLLTVYYSENNIQGSQQSEEGDAKTLPWDAIVPGTRDESNFAWACGAGSR